MAQDRRRNGVDHAMVPLIRLVLTDDWSAAAAALRLQELVDAPQATRGVRLVHDRAALAALAREWNGEGVFAHGGVLVQSPAAGPLVMVQSVFARGRMVASHANLRVREGASGGASHKRSVELPDVRDQLARLRARL